MKTLKFRYEMKLTYEKPVVHCNYSIRCIPVGSSCQRVLSYTYWLSPDMSGNEGIDAFGNHYLYGSIETKHECFQYFVNGKVECGLDVGETAGLEEFVMKYRHPHGKNQSGINIRRYYESLPLCKEEGNFAKAVRLMNFLYKDFVYEPLCTTVNTTAEEAFTLGKGVCQDYAHILISLCHLAGIPAKYIAGMMVGEGSSHAWVEIYDQGKWYGLDPTNNLIVTDQHIKVNCGRDAMDCQINRGLLIGGGNQKQEIHVLVEECEEAEETENGS